MRSLPTRPPAATGAGRYPRTVAGLLAGGAAGALLSFLIAPPLLQELALCTALAGAAFATGMPRAAVPMSMLGIGAAAMPMALPGHEVFALLCGGAMAGGGLHVLAARSTPPAGRPGRTTAAALVAASALALLLGWRAVSAIEASGAALAILPAPLAAVALGAALSVFLALAAAVGHLVVEPDPVEQRHARIAGSLGATLRPLADRAVEAHRACRKALAGRDDPAFARLGERLAEASSRTLDLVARSHELDRELSLRSRESPEKRLEELARLRRAASDPAALSSYDLAARLVEEERTCLARIRLDHDRVVARLHAQLALLERARFSLLNLASAGAIEDAASVARTIEPLSDLAAELDSHGAAVSEAASGRELSRA